MLKFQALSEWRKILDVSLTFTQLFVACVIGQVKKKRPEALGKWVSNEFMEMNTGHPLKTCSLCVCVCGITVIGTENGTSLHS